MGNPKRHTPTNFELHPDYGHQGRVSLSVLGSLPAGRLKKVGIWLMNSLYRRQWQYICERRLETNLTLTSSQLDDNTPLARCTIIETPEALGKLAANLRGSVPLEKLLERINRGCVVFLASTKDPDNHDVFAGYSIRQRGVFSALGRQRRISDEILFSHYVEIPVEFRGKRIAELLSRAADFYGHEKGLTKIVAVVSPSNESSLRHIRRSGYRIVGKVERISIFRGSYVWETPWKLIENSIAG